MSGAVRARIEGPVTSIDDHTIVAIASLAAVEHDRRNMRPLKVHMRGLTAAVRARGGLSTMYAEHPIAAGVVFWYATTMCGELGFFPLSLDKL